MRKLFQIIWAWSLLIGYWFIGLFQSTKTKEPIVTNKLDNPKNSKRSFYGFAEGTRKTRRNKRRMQKLSRQINFSYS